MTILFDHYYGNFLRLLHLYKNIFHTPQCLIKLCTNPKLLKSFTWYAIAVWCIFISDFPYLKYSYGVSWHPIDCTPFHSFKFVETLFHVSEWNTVQYLLITINNFIVSKQSQFLPVSDIFISDFPILGIQL